MLNGHHRQSAARLLPLAEPGTGAASLARAGRIPALLLARPRSAPGQYNFSTILADLAAARQSGRKFAFRLRMMVSYDDDTVYAPAWLVNHPQCAVAAGFWADADAADPGLTWVPDWNDQYLLARSRCWRPWPRPSAPPTAWPGSMSACSASTANGRCAQACMHPHA
ncbi:hypothetical protein LP420_03905 [Massilia sp. B-10]|nr:hypothetical protein LP420_03905 [Massilia sp. B-10]